MKNLKFLKTPLTLSLFLLFAIGSTLQSQTCIEDDCDTTETEIDISGLTCSFSLDAELYICCDNIYPEYANFVIVYNNSSSDLAVRVMFHAFHRQTKTIDANDCATFSTSPFAYDLTDVNVAFAPDEFSFGSGCYVEFDQNCL